MTKVFEPQLEIAALKKRIEQLESEVQALRNRVVDPFAYIGGKWCPPADVGGQYWLNPVEAISTQASQHVSH